LKMLGARGGVVAQAVQRIVNARRGKKRERLGTACGFESAVGDVVVHRAQIGEVKHISHQSAAVWGNIAFHMIVIGKGEVNGNRLVAGADLQLNAMVF
jgi:hypothetical protein